MELTNKIKISCMRNLLGVMDDAEGNQSVGRTASDWVLQDLDLKWDTDEDSEANDALMDEIGDYLGELVELMEVPIWKLIKEMEV